MIRFFIRQTNTPDTGPMEKEAIKAGTSEKSSLIKLGMNGTENERDMSTAESAANTAVYAIYLTREKRYFAIPQPFPVRTIPSVGGSHPVGAVS